MRKRFDYIDRERVDWAENELKKAFKELKPASVSVIIPCYRCSDTIERAVASVAAQTLQPAEVILVDDCSGDGTLSALSKVQMQYPQGWIKVISSQENGGAGAARNAGWDVATQHYIAFLDSDDSWHPLKLEIQYNWMMDHPDVALTGHACQLVDENVSQVDFSIDTTFHAVSKNNLLLSNRFSTPSVMLRRDIQQRFSDGKRYCEDYQLWLEICCAGLLCCRSNLPLANLYKAAYGDAGLSAALWKMEKGQLDSYRSIYKDRKIGRGVLLALYVWSFFRYFLRVSRVYVRKTIGAI